MPAAWKRATRRPAVASAQERHQRPCWKSKDEDTERDETNSELRTNESRPSLYMQVAKRHWATDGGQSFTPNIQISAGTSNAHASGNGIDFGDYSGLAFYGGVAHPAWSDNSNSTGNNPDGALHKLDIYTAAVRVTH